MFKRKYIPLYDVIPVEIAFIGPEKHWNPYFRESISSGYKMNIKFKGNILPLVHSASLSRDYGLLPRRSEMILREYDSHKDVTYVWYLFPDGLFVNGQKRAEEFRNKIQAQIDSIKKNENTK